MARPRDPELERARRAQIADATIELLCEESWRSVTLSSVARRAGVSKGVVTYWYENKDRLLIEALKRFHQRYEARLLAIAMQPIDARRKLEALIEAALPSKREVIDELRFQIEVLSYAKAHPEAETAVREAYDHFRVACEALIEVGAAEGYVTTTQREGLYQFIHALIDGLSMQIAYSPEVDLPETRGRALELIERWLLAP